MLLTSNLTFGSWDSEFAGRQCVATRDRVLVNFQFKAASEPEPAHRLQVLVRNDPTVEE